MPSTHKKVIVRKLDRDSAQGYITPADFVKQVRAHSPECKIILIPWWIPRGPDATNEGVMKAF